MQTIDSPNFSVVVPQTCKNRCHFCFCDRSIPNASKDYYLDKLKGLLTDLPEQFFQCSITGGEPSDLPWLPELAMVLRRRFKKIILTTALPSNGDLSTFKEALKFVDHVNISIHSPDASIHREITRHPAYTLQLLQDAVNAVNEKMVLPRDVSLACVTDEMSQAELNNYIFFAQSLGVPNIFIRRNHQFGIKRLEADLKLEKEGFPVNVGSCPACLTRAYLHYGSLKGVVFKYSVPEPSTVMDMVFELIYHQDGLLTFDWNRRLPVTKSLKDLKSELPLALRVRKMLEMESVDKQVADNIIAAIEQDHGKSSRRSSSSSEGVSSGGECGNYRKSSSGCGSSGCSSTDNGCSHKSSGGCAG